MEIIMNILLFLHIVSISLVFGIWVGNFKRAIVVPGQFHASVLALATGFGMYFIRMDQEMQISHMVVGIKMLLAIIICAAAFKGQLKYKQARAAGTPEAGRSIPLAHAVGGLALINIALAMFI